MAKELPKRSEVNEAFTWKLEDMYPSVDAWEADVQKARELTKELAAMAGQITASAENLFTALEKNAELMQIISL